MKRLVSFVPGFINFWLIMIGSFYILYQLTLCHIKYQLWMIGYYSDISSLNFKQLLSTKYDVIPIKYNPQNVISDLTAFQSLEQSAVFKYIHPWW